MLITTTAPKLMLITTTAPKLMLITTTAPKLIYLFEFLQEHYVDISIIVSFQTIA